MLMHEELRIIDTWRFAKRMPSTAAIRELLKRGLAAEGRARDIARIVPIRNENIVLR